VVPTIAAAQPILPYPAFRTTVSVAEREGLMPRYMVGVLAAAGATMAALVGLVHGDWVPVMIVGAGTTTGLAACLAPSAKKDSGQKLMAP
jgi:hypothetical protein